MVTPKPSKVVNEGKKELERYDYVHFKTVFTVYFYHIQAKLVVMQEYGQY